MTDYLGPLSNTLRRLSGPGHHDHGFGWRAEEVERDLIAHGFEITVKPADPIVWDGSDEAFEAIRSALSGIADDVLAPNTDGVLRELVLLCHGGGVLSCTHGGRIQAIGDSFVILPPEVTA